MNPAWCLISYGFWFPVFTEQISATWIPLCSSALQYLWTCSHIITSNGGLLIALLPGWVILYRKPSVFRTLDLLQYSASFLWADSIQINFLEQLLTLLIQNHPRDELMHQALHISYCIIWNSAENLFRTIRNLGVLVSNSKHTSCYVMLIFCSNF